MGLLWKLRKLLMKHFVEVSWRGLFSVVLAYGASSWLLLWACGETALITNGDFFYWLVVTGSTVGYGDLSPATLYGKLVVAIWVIPLGLGIFALTIGRIAAFATFQWRKSIRGLRQVKVDNHILVLGWNEERTPSLLKLLLREQQASANGRPVVLCVRADIENPMPEEIQFVWVQSFNNDDEMDRAGIDRASCILIDTDLDDITMTCALYSHARNPDAHIVAYFQDESLTGLLKLHCPNVECMPSVAVEMLVKSAVDPGSSALHHQLLDARRGNTQYSILYPEQEVPITMECLFEGFKRVYEATLIGLVCPNSTELILNPPLQYQVEPGTHIYYIADRRLMDVDWGEFHV